MASKLRNKINNAIQIDNELVENEIQYLENYKTEKIRREIIKSKVLQLIHSENMEAQIKENIELGRKATKSILSNK